MSRSRSGFSPSVVRKSVQRERMLPVMCFTMIGNRVGFVVDRGEKLLVAVPAPSRARQALVITENREGVLNVGGCEFKRHGDSVFERWASILRFAIAHNCMPRSWLIAVNMYFDLPAFRLPGAEHPRRIEAPRQAGRREQSRSRRRRRESA